MTRFQGLVLVASLFVASTAEDCGSPTTAQREFQSTETNQQRLVAATPLPALTQSLERQNLTRRLQRVNQAHLTSYIYLISQTGKVMAFYTVDGKVTSLNSYLTPETRPARYGEGVAEIEVPDLDGAYGKNSDGVFFFTTEGVYVEWHGDYLWSDQPLKLSQPPELIYVLPSPAR